MTVMVPVAVFAIEVGASVSTPDPAFDTPRVPVLPLASKPLKVVLAWLSPGFTVVSVAVAELLFSVPAPLRAAIYWVLNPLVEKVAPDWISIGEKGEVLEVKPALIVPASIVVAPVYMPPYLYPKVTVAALVVVRLLFSVIVLPLTAMTRSPPVMPPAVVMTDMPGRMPVASATIKVGEVVVVPDVVEVAITPPKTNVPAPCLVKPKLPCT